MITEVRDYFMGVVQTVDSDLDFDGFIFDTESTGHTTIDNTFKLVLLDSGVSRLDTSYDNSMSVEVWIYKSSGYDRVEDFDETYCKAIEIAAVGMDQSRIDQEGYIKSVIAGSVSSEKFEDNDNAMRFRIQFSVSIHFSIED